MAVNMQNATSRSILTAAAVLFALSGVLASTRAAESPRWWVIAEEPEGCCAMYPYLLRLQSGDLLCSYYSQKWKTDRRYTLFRQEHLDPPRPTAAGIAPRRTNPPDPISRLGEDLVGS
jgi:hypothetical protein